MAYSWFICQYQRVPGYKIPMRECAMNNFNAEIFGDGGTWSEVEVLGNYALVKVRASNSTLNQIGNTSGFQRIPNSLTLSDTLGGLTTNQLITLRNLILSMGYTNEEINSSLGADWQSRTLRQVFNFIASRRLKPRYDPLNDEIVLDGDPQTCRPLDDADQDVQ